MGDKPTFGIECIAFAQNRAGALRMDRWHRVGGDVLAVHYAAGEGGNWVSLVRPYASPDAARMMMAAGV